MRPTRTVCNLLCGLALLAVPACGGAETDGSRATTLPPIDAAARSCELLLEDRGASVVGADFGDSVRGETIRQAPRTAVTFFAKSDAPIARSAVRIRLSGEGEMTIARARCFDRTGQPIAGGGVATGS